MWTQIEVCKKVHTVNKQLDRTKHARQKRSHKDISVCTAEIYFSDGYMSEGFHEDGLERLFSEFDLECVS